MINILNKNDMEKLFLLYTKPKDYSNYKPSYVDPPSQQPSTDVEHPKYNTFPVNLMYEQGFVNVDPNTILRYTSSKRDILLP